MIKRNVLLNPGPATTTEGVKLAQLVPDICPREKEFGELMHSISLDLKKIATKNYQNYETILFGGSGTAGVESALTSFCPFNKKTLIINNGAYGKRMIEIAHVFQIPHIIYESPWDSPIDFNNLRNFLSNQKDIS